VYLFDSASEEYYDLVESNFFLFVDMHPRFSIRGKIIGITKKPHLSHIAK